MALFKLLLWVAEKIREQAEAELHDEDHLRREVAELHRALESGQISEVEFERREAELVGRIVAIEEERRAAEKAQGDGDATR